MGLCPYATFVTRGFAERLVIGIFFIHWTLGFGHCSFQGFALLSLRSTLTSSMSPGASNIGPGRKARDAALVLVALIAAFFLFHNLGTYALWDDEANTGIVAQGVWATGDTLAQVGDNLSAWGDGLNLTGRYERSQPPLQFYLCAPFVGLLGPTALAARLPFALIGLGTVIALLLWARKAASSFEYAAWCVALLGSVSFFLYCRQARYYAPALAFTLGACWAYWSLLRGRGRRRELILGLMLAGVLISNYLCCAALMLSLFADYMLWGRTCKRLSLRSLAALALPLLIVGLPVLWIWYPLGRYASDALDPSEQGAWLRKARYCWWFFRDASVSQLVSGVLLVACPWLFRLQRNTWHLRVPCAIGVYLLANALLAPQGGWDFAAIRYAMPVVLGGLALTVLVSGAVYARSHAAGVAVLLLASLTNVLYLDWVGGWLIGPVPKLMPALFIGELLHPQEEPYTPVAQWVRENVAPGALVVVGPTYARYPLMYHAPQAVYGWQLSPETAEKRFAGVDPRQIRGSVAPDYMVCFGPGFAILKAEMSRRLIPGLAYTPVAAIDRYSIEEYRPEIYMRRFGKPPPYPPQFQILIFKRAPALDRLLPGAPQEGVWHTGEG